MSAEHDRYLIVNADDFGRSVGVNRAIAKAHDVGIVTSTSMLVRRPLAKEAAALAQMRPNLSVGLHVDLGEWRYDSARGWTPRYELPTPDTDSVAREVLAQLEKFRVLTGNDPTHLDSHQHVHNREPVKSALRHIADVLGVPLRHYSPIRYCGKFYGLTEDERPLPGPVSTAALLEIVTALPAGYTELCCHPDDERETATEVDALCDPRVQSALRDVGVKLGSFREWLDSH